MVFKQASPEINRLVKLEKWKVGQTNDHYLYRAYYENGQLKEEGKKHKAFEIGLWTFYDKNGQRIAEGNFHEHIEAINIALLHKNVDISKRDKKKLKKLPQLRKFNGVPTGKWMYWNKEGKHTGTLLYNIENNEKLLVKIIYI